MNYASNAAICAYSLTLISLFGRQVVADDKSTVHTFTKSAVVEVAPVIDDTQVIAEVTFAGRQRQVYVSKLFLSQYEGFAKDRELSEQQQKGLVKFNFYVAPALNFTAAEAARAFDRRQALDNGQSAMECDLQLLPDDLRVAAKDEINRRYPHARLARENISLVPYSYLELWADIGSSESRVASYPHVDISSLSALGQPKGATTPTIIEVELIGSEGALRSFSDNPKFTAVYVVGGFAIEQNILNFSLERFAQTGLQQLLTGDASWNTKFDAIRRLKNMGKDVERVLDIAPAKSESWVTRYQVKELSKEYLESIRGVIWREFGENRNEAALLEEFLMNLTTRASRESEATIIEKQKAFVVDSVLSADIGPDVIRDINLSLNGHLRDRQRQLSESQSKDEDESEATREVREEEFEDSDGTKWSIHGEVVVPKSIRVFQFNQADFTSWLRRSYVSIEAAREAFRFAETNQSKRVIDPVHLTSFRIHLDTDLNGDNKEKEGSVEVVLWRGEAGAEVEITRRSGIGAGIFWPDGNRHHEDFSLDPNIAIDGDTRFRFEIILSGKNVKWKPNFKIEAWTRNNEDMSKPPTKTTPILIEEKESREAAPAVWNRQFRW